MEYIVTTLDNLIHQTAFFNLTLGNYLMIVIACVFLYLAIARGFEPLLLLPIAFGMLLVISIRTSCSVRRTPQTEQAVCFITSMCWMNGRSCRR